MSRSTISPFGEFQSKSYWSHSFFIIIDVCFDLCLILMLLFWGGLCIVSRLLVLTNSVMRRASSGDTWVSRA